MPVDDQPDDERPEARWVPDPEDRLWRHPSELAGGAARPAAWGTPGSSAERHRIGATVTVGALAGACLAGALVAFGAMWVVRPTKVAEQAVTTSSAVKPISSAVAPFAVGSAPVGPLATSAASATTSVVRVQAERDGRWSNATAIWIDSAGTLATAAAAVQGADQVVVTGADGARRSASIAGVDDLTGIAALVVDDPVGSPLGLSSIPVVSGERTALVGINRSSGSGLYGPGAVAAMTVRSAIQRATVAGHVVHNAMQLDGEIPDTAVGGGLIDLDGRLVGLVIGNSAEQNLGAAVPAATVMRVATDLRDHGKVDRAWLGVRAVDLDPSAASLLGLAGGAKLTEITPASPAATAGLQAGDILTAVDNTQIHTASDLVVALARRSGGTQVTLTLVRAGQAQAIQVTLGG